MTDPILVSWKCENDIEFEGDSTRRESNIMFQLLYAFNTDVLIRESAYVFFKAGI